MQVNYQASSIKVPTPTTSSESQPQPQRLGWLQTISQMQTRLWNAAYRSFQTVEVPAIVSRCLANVQSRFKKVEKTGVFPQDPLLKTKKLDNGLTYYVRHNAYPVPQKASLRLVIKAGFVNETPEERGIAHLIEHIVQHETQAFAKDEIKDYLRSKGLKWGSDHNAYTTLEETGYEIDISLDDPETLEKCLFILSEMATKATLSDSIIEHEREIVIDELKQRFHGAWNRYSSGVKALLFQGTPCAGVVDVDQEIQAVKTCPPDVIRKFYERWYQPGNMAVIAVGDFDVEKTTGLIQRYFGNMPPQLQVMTFSDPEIVCTEVNMYYSFDLLKFGTSELERVKEAYLRTIFAQIFNQRLACVSTEENIPLTSASVEFLSAKMERVFFNISAQPHEGRTTDALQRLLLEVERLKKHGILQTEYDRIKGSIIEQLEIAINSPGEIGPESFIEIYKSSFKNRATPYDLEALVRLIKILVKDITLEELNKHLSAWLTDQRRVISIVTPEKADLAPVDRKEIEAIAKAPIEDVALPVDTNVDFLPLKDKLKEIPVVATQFFPKAAMTEYTLINGMRLFVKPTQFQKEAVTFSLVSPRGTLTASKEALVAAKFAPHLFSETGLGEMDVIQLKTALAQRNINAIRGIRDDYTQIAIVCTPKYIETVFRLCYLLFTQPNYDRKGFDRALKASEEDLRNLTADPESVFNAERRAANTENSPEARSLQYTELNLINYEASKQFLQGLFSDPSEFTLSIIGNVQSDKIKKLAEKYLSGITKKQSSNGPIEYPLIPFPKGIVRKEVSVGKEPSTSSIYTFPTPITDHVQERAQASWCCEILQQRLHKALRLDIGKTYFQSCSFSGSKFPVTHAYEPSRVIIELTGGPESQSELDQGLMQQIKDLQQNGPTDAEMNDFKKHILQALRDALNTNEGWIMVTINAAMGWRNPDDFEAIETELEQFTIEDAKAIYNKIFNMENYTAFTLLPKKDPVA